MNTNFLNKIKSVPMPHHLNRAGLQLKKHSPEILTGVGIAGLLGAGILACKATLKLEDVIDELEDRKETLRKVQEQQSEASEESDKQHKTAHVAIHIKAGLDIAKLYGPAVTMGLASAACIVGAHGIMKKRNAALAVAYNAVEKSYREYRRRVEETLGEEQARDIYMDVQSEKVKDEETGEEQEVKAPGDPSKYSMYAKVFDELNVNWQKNSEQNFMFLRCQQNWANDLLRSRGHLFLNEVYDMIGLPHTTAGAVVGWLWDSKEGDNFVDFGIFDSRTQEAHDFVNGLERSIWLDFNVQGTIYDRI